MSVNDSRSGILFSNYNNYANLSISNTIVSNCSSTSVVSYSGLIGEINENYSVISMVNVTESSSCAVKATTSYAGGVVGSITSLGASIVLNKLSLNGTVSTGSYAGVVFGHTENITSSSGSNISAANLKVNGVTGGPCSLLWAAVSFVNCSCT